MRIVGPVGFNPVSDGQHRFQPNVMKQDVSALIQEQVYEVKINQNEIKPVISVHKSKVDFQSLLHQLRKGGVRKILLQDQGVGKTEMLEVLDSQAAIFIGVGINRVMGGFCGCHDVSRRATEREPDLDSRMDILVSQEVENGFCAGICGEPHFKLLS